MWVNIKATILNFKFGLKILWSEFERGKRKEVLTTEREFLRLSPLTLKEVVLSGQGTDTRSWLAACDWLWVPRVRDSVVPYGHPKFSPVVASLSKPNCISPSHRVRSCNQNRTAAQGHHCRHHQMSRKEATTAYAGTRGTSSYCCPNELVAVQWES